MRTTISGVLVLLSSVPLASADASSSAPGQTLALRNAYYRAEQDSEAAERFYDQMKSEDSTGSPRILGFKGMAAMLRASHAYNPVNKLRFFNEGKALLEAAIDEAPDDPELRFFRFCIQDNAPFFLSYQGSLQDDKSHLFRFLSDESASRRDADLLERIAAYLQKHVRLSARESFIVTTALKRERGR